MIFYYVVIPIILVGLLAYYLLQKLWPVSSNNVKVQALLKEKDPELFKKFQQLSEKLNYPMETIIYVHYAMLKNIDEGEDNAEKICRNFLDLVQELYSKSSKEGMVFLKISNSRQVGKIAFEVIRAEILPQIKGLKQSDFEGLFTI